jgi:hypothetical protein
MVSLGSRACRCAACRVEDLPSEFRCPCDAELGRFEYGLRQTHEFAGKDSAGKRLGEFIGRRPDSDGAQLDFGKGTKPVAIPRLRFMGWCNSRRNSEFAAGPRLVHGETAVCVVLACFLRSQLRDLNSGPAVYETAALPLS